MKIIFFIAVLFTACSSEKTNNNIKEVDSVEEITDSIPDMEAFVLDSIC